MHRHGEQPRPAQLQAAEASKAAYQDKLREARFGAITTEIVDAPPFYFAEDYHQQYLHKNPEGYCGMGGTGVTCPIGIVTGDSVFVGDVGRPDLLEKTRAGGATVRLDVR